MSRFSFSSRVRAHKDVSDSEDDIASSASSSSSDNSGLKSENAGHRIGDENEEESPDEASISPDIEATSLSFGDLARAQASIQNDQQPPEDLDDESSRRSTKRKASDPLEKPSSKKRPSGSTRSSKHAPQALSSKHAVSRTRTILPTNKPASRDPRFDPLAGNLNSNQHQQNYSFLKDYRNTEISSLKSTLKALDRRRGLSEADREAEREGLKSAIQRLTSKTKTEQLKDKEREVIRQHRKEERDKVRAGKQPYFLKRGELKKRVEDKRFEGVGEKKKERTMEKRRKKQAGKEKKLLPERRVG